MDFYEVIDTITCETTQVEQFILKILKEEGYDAVIRTTEGNKTIITVLGKE